MTLYRQVNDERIELTAEEEVEERDRRAKNEAEQAATQYARDRQSEYPSFADQFDQIFHEGIDKWKETIQAVKDAHPKP